MARCYSITAASLVSRASCKRLASRYTGGPSRNWVKSKCPGWKRINSERYRLFEGPRKTELTEAQRTLARSASNSARVIERLRSPPLSHGIARELRKTTAMQIAKASNSNSEVMFTRASLARRLAFSSSG
jgi:hypothetical protein